MRLDSRIDKDQVKNVIAAYREKGLDYLLSDLEAYLLGKHVSELSDLGCHLLEATENAAISSLSLLQKAENHLKRWRADRGQG